MKIYHKFLLYQNKLLKPYVRILLGLVEALTYLASLLLIVGVVYEHGFPLSVDEVANLQTLYKTVWIIFLIDVTLHISLEYRNTKKQYRRLAWILSGLLYLTLIPVIFHRPEEEGAILQIWEFLHGKFYHLLLLLVLSFLNLSNGLVRLLGRRTNPSLILAVSFMAIILIGAGLLMLPRCTVNGITWVDSLFTATSAVCVTGLVPVDVSTTFTTSGLVVIILLIQIGGLGVMTLTSFFAMFFPQLIQWAGAPVGTAYQSVFDIGSQFYGYYPDWSRSTDASALHGEWYYLGRLFIYGYQCRMCYRFGSGRCIHYIHHFRISCHYPVDSDWRIRSDDINQFLCHVLHGKHLHL